VVEVVTQFHSSSVQPAELNQIAAEYLALERVRVLRRLLVRRFGLLSLAVLVARIALHWISLTATACSLAAFVVPPVWAWVVEIRRDRVLARRLERIPGVIQTHVPKHTQPASAEPVEKVVKSS
jgi:Flp pilus assembly protein TadB